MLAETQDQRYFNRMASSLGDKRQLLNFIVGEKVLDVGAGGGELAEAMRLAGHTVWALDGSHTAIKRMADSYPKLHLLQGLAHEVEHMVPEGHFDTIVCSSIFHEVYSYGIPETGPYTVRALAATLQALHRVLKPGGRLIVRDGVMPSAWDQEVFLTFADDEGGRFWEAYHRHAPFASWAGVGQRCIHLEKVAPRRFRANLESAMEFLYTYTWGWQSSEREMKELYGVFTEEAYRSFIGDQGFTVEESASYLQPGYAQHLLPKVRLETSEGKPVPLPASNFILVAERH